MHAEMSLCIVCDDIKVMLTKKGSIYTNALPFKQLCFYIEIFAIIATFYALNYLNFIH